MIQSGNLLYTYTKRFACFCCQYMAAKEYLIRDGRSLDFNLGISYALLLSQFLLSTTYFDRSFIVVVESLLM